MVDLDIVSNTSRTNGDDGDDGDDNIRVNKLKLKNKKDCNWKDWLTLHVLSFYLILVYLFSRDLDRYVSIGRYGIHKVERFTLMNLHRVIGYMLMHVNGIHLLSNLVGLYIFGGILVGSGVNILGMIVLCGILSGMGTYSFGVTRMGKHIVGISGGVYGLIGGALCDTLVNVGKHNQKFTFVLLLLCLFILACELHTIKHITRIKNGNLYAIGVHLTGIWIGFLVVLSGLMTPHHSSSFITSKSSLSKLELSKSHDDNGLLGLQSCVEFEPYNLITRRVARVILFVSVVWIVTRYIFFRLY